MMDTMTRSINFKRVQETTWVGEKTKELDNSLFKLWYISYVISRNKLGVIVDKKWKMNILDVQRIGDWSITLKVIVEQDTFNVLSAYAP